MTDELQYIESTGISSHTTEDDMNIRYSTSEGRIISMRRVY